MAAGLALPDRICNRRSCDHCPRLLIPAIELLDARHELRRGLSCRQRLPLERTELRRYIRLVNSQVINHNRQKEGLFVRKGSHLGFVNGEVPFNAKEATPWRQSPARNERHEQGALANAAAQFRFPVIAQLKLVAVEEDINTRRLEGALDFFGGSFVLAGVAQEHSTGFGWF